MLNNRPDRAPRLSELRFQYQPIVSLSEGLASWSEALVRWHLSDGTIRGPNDVLPHWLAAPRQEEFTRFSLERAAVALALHSTAQISVNLSPKQVTHPMTVTILEELLPAIRARLRIELTEQHFFDTAALWDSLTAIRERCGVVLLDDVTISDIDSRAKDGCPVDGVKLDRSVVMGLGDRDLRQGLVRFVRDVTQRFPIVVAEGVEDSDWCDELRAIGVSHVQGFGIGRPKPDLVEPIYEPHLPAGPSDGGLGVRLNLDGIMSGGVVSELSD